MTKKYVFGSFFYHTLYAPTNAVCHCHTFPQLARINDMLEKFELESAQTIELSPSEIEPPEIQEAPKEPSHREKSSPVSQVNNLDREVLDSPAPPKTAPHMNFQSSNVVPGSGMFKKAEGLEMASPVPEAKNGDVHAVSTLTETAEVKSNDTDVVADMVIQALDYYMTSYAKDGEVLADPVSDTKTEPESDEANGVIDIVNEALAYYMRDADNDRKHSSPIKAKNGKLHP